MKKILISACLAGDNVKYNGGNNFADNPHIRKWLSEGRLVKICPESDGGLSTPRPPSEIIGDRVVNIQGDDVTAAFAKGARLALEKAEANGISYAILKQGSPSCGSKRIYDGTFTGVKIDGMGVAAKLLRQNGIEIFDETQINELAALIDGE